MAKNWSDCLKLYRDLQDETPGIVERRRTKEEVHRVDFRDIGNRWNSTNWPDQICKVNKTLQRSGGIESVNLSQCGLSGEQMSALYDVFEDVPFDELRIGYNTNLGKEGWKSIGKVVKRSWVTSLQVKGCDLSANLLSGFIDALDGAKISELDISDNRYIEAEGWISLGKLTAQSGLKKLIARNCAPRAEYLMKFVERMEKSKLNFLDLSDGRGVNVDALLKILPRVNERLVLNDYEYFDDDLAKLQDKLRTDNSTLTIEMEDSIGETFYVTAPGELPHVSTSPSVKIDKDINEKLVVTKEVSMGPDGGRISVSGCGVAFATSVLEPGAKVFVTVDSCSTDVPRRYVGATPEIRIHSTQPQLNNPVEVTLPVYRTPDDNKYHIIHKRKDGEKWRGINANPKQEGKVLKFLTGLWGRIKAVLPERKLSKLSLVQYLYYKSESSSLYSIICLANDEVMSACDKDAIEKGFEPALVKPDEIFLRGDDNLSYRIMSLNENTCVDPPDKVNITRKVFTGISYYQMNFLVEPEDLTIPALKIKYELSTPILGTKPSVLMLAWKKRYLAPIDLDEMANSVSCVKVTTSAATSTRESQILMSGLLGRHGNYPMFYEVKGTVLIINNEFKGQKGERKGSHIDVKNLEALWRDMTFQVRTETNLTAEQMRLACSKFAADAQNVGVTVLIIMSHGGKRDGKEFFSGENNEPVYSKDIILFFTSENSRHLSGIPKVFLFQACRGGQVETDSEATNVDTDDEVDRCRNMRDMLIAYPSQSGAVSFRHPETGSWMMNAVTNVFMQCAHDTDVLAMMTMVNGVVEKKESRNGAVQTSNQFNSLTKRLFLYPGHTYASLLSFVGAFNKSI